MFVEFVWFGTLELLVELPFEASGLSLLIGNGERGGVLLNCGSGNGKAEGLFSMGRKGGRLSCKDKGRGGGALIAE